MAARKTVRKGIAKVPVMIQLETLECGAVSLAMCLAYYGLYLPLEQMRKECGVSRDGSNLKNIYLVAKKIRLDPHAYRFSTGQLRQNATFPALYIGILTILSCSGGFGQVRLFERSCAGYSKNALAGV